MAERFEGERDEARIEKEGLNMEKELLELRNQKLEEERERAVVEFGVVRMGRELEREWVDEEMKEVSGVRTGGGEEDHDFIAHDGILMDS